MGFAAAGPARDGGLEGLGEIHAIYLLREAWSQGLGRALMAQALAGLREAGFPAAVLWVLERNARGRRFYEAGGWQLSGAPRTIWQDGIALREVQYRLDLDAPSREVV
jgi:GNAT superfamily N-acetyltransferase